MTDPMNALWRAQQDAAANFTESWRTMLQPAGDRTARPPAPSAADADAVNDDADDREQLVDAEPDDESGATDEIAEPEPEPDDESGATDEIAEPEPEPEPGPSVADAFQAIQALRDGQRDLAQHLTRWADLQRDLADATTAWARRQRDQADALDRVLAPLSQAAAERPMQS